MASSWAVHFLMLCFDFVMYSSSFSGFRPRFDFSGFSFKAFSILALILESYFLRVFFVVE